MSRYQAFGIGAILAVFVMLMLAWPPVAYSYGKYYCYWISAPSCTRPY